MKSIASYLRLAFLFTLTPAVLAGPTFTSADSPDSHDPIPGERVTAIHDHDPITEIDDPLRGPVAPQPLAGSQSRSVLRLSLVPDYGSPPVEPGDFIVVSLELTNINGPAVAGFQAFINFNQSELAFVHGTYTNEPFGLPIILPIEADGFLIRLAAGIDPVIGQEPTNESAVLAQITFEVLNGGCVAPVFFALHEPPTMLTDLSGNPLGPLEFEDVPQDICIADIVRNCVVDVSDLLLLLSQWHNTSGPADINEDGIVNVSDLLILLGAWGPCI